MVAIPPECEAQADVPAAIRTPGHTGSTVSILRESGPLQQLVFLVYVPLEKPKRGSQVVVEANYDVTPTKRQLKEGKPPQPVPPLAPKDRAVYLAETKEYDFKIEVFEKWRREQKLIRAKDESDLAFGHRTFEAISQTIRYDGKTGIDPASRVCADGKGACGGLANVFVAVMRGNGFPARVLYGRLLNRARATADEIHCMAEFFADGIGWVPVDVPRKLYGQEPGNFLVLHFDPIIWGKEREALQSMWPGFSDQEGTWDGSSKTIQTKLLDPDVELRRP
jgi:transglutaminase-like putative cysteine protease